MSDEEPNLNDAVTTCPGCRRDVLLRLNSCPQCGTAADSSSALISFRYAGSGGGVIDQLTAKFLRSDLGAPSQADLDLLFTRATHIQLKVERVIGKLIEFEMTLEVRTPGDLEALGSALRIEDSGGHMLCFEDHQLEFFSGEDSLATLGLIGASVLRWSDRWGTDARVLDPDAVADYFAARGHDELRDRLDTDRASQNE